MARRWPRSFADRLTSPLPDPLQVLRMMRGGGFRGGGSCGDAAGAGRIPVRRDPLPAATPSVTWAGHASFLLRLGGVSALVDPVLSERILGAGRRLTPPGLQRVPPVDMLLISHNHYDHLDAATVRRLPRRTRVVVPGGLGRWFRRRGFRAVTELDWWESADVGGVAVDLVPAHHWSRRSPFDACASLWGGWVLTAPGGPRLYHAGDSGYGPYFTEIGARYPGIDVAMLPVGSYTPRWFMGPMHVDPEEAVQVASDVGARVMVPMHWGTFRLSREPVLEPIERTRAAWAAAGRGPGDLWDLAIGETRLLRPPP
ncbi:MAG: MBL fold metallo-hydrolase [Pseudonocardiaceae bacterium]